ncbi:MAG TPA: hypothetical protein DEB06_05650 [Phycisphaerales bacterium]|nr:hypothetical protein [Phycisphaerales bacterium]
MSPSLGAIEAWRLTLLPLVTPMAIVWSVSPHSGGVLMVLAHALLVLFCATSLDAAFRRESLDPRLSPWRDRYRINPARAAGASAFIVFAMALVVIGLLFVAPRVGVLAGSSAALIALTTTRSARAARRFMFAEWAWPLGALVGPALFIGLPGWSAAGPLTAPQDAMPGSVVAGTIVAALMLGACVLLCLIRDERADRVDGLRTTPTTFGRPAAAALLAVWVLAAAALAAWGAAEHAWGWPVTACCAWTALLTFWAVGAERDALAVGLWWTGASITSTLLAIDLLRAA